MTQHHCDFRLETKDGVLSSWAVPKGISFDPKVKRLAIRTVDHPVEYLHFEGVIPSGNYGAGTVIVWDTGSYVTDLDISIQIQDGRISITLMGKKLKGKFMLVRRKAQLEEENHWLAWMLIEEMHQKGEFQKMYWKTLWPTKSITS